MSVERQCSHTDFKITLPFLKLKAEISKISPLQFQQLTQRHLFYTLLTKLTLRFTSHLLVTAWYSMNSLRSRCQVLEGRHGTKVSKLRCFFKR